MTQLLEAELLRSNGDEEYSFSTEQRDGLMSPRNTPPTRSGTSGLEKPRSETMPPTEEKMYVQKQSHCSMTLCLPFALAILMSHPITISLNRFHRTINRPRNRTVKRVPPGLDAMALSTTNWAISGVQKNGREKRRIPTDGSSRSSAKNRRPKDRARTNKPHRPW